MESYYSAREMADVDILYGSAMEILGKHVASTQNTIHKAESNPTNYSSNNTSD
jgi:hypothetical protein